MCCAGAEARLTVCPPVTTPSPPVTTRHPPSPTVTCRYLPLQARRIELEELSETQLRKLLVKLGGGSADGGHLEASTTELVKLAKRAMAQAPCCDCACCGCCGCCGYKLLAVWLTERVTGKCCGYKLLAVWLTEHVTGVAAAEAACLLA